MKFISYLLFFCSLSLCAQYDYEPNTDHPFGQANPKAPQQIKDFEQLIGICDCTSQNKNQDGIWADPISMTWKFKYIMNGMAIQDETLKADGKHSGSIRQFIADSSRWYVHYYSSASPSTLLPVWEGEKQEGKIILYRDQKAPNGTEGFYRLSFFDISKSGYKWIGEWVDKSETITFPSWRITCSKRIN